MTDRVTGESHEEFHCTESSREQSGQSPESAAPTQTANDGQSANEAAPADASAEPAPNKDPQPGNAVAPSFGSPMPEVPDLLARIAGRIADKESNEAKAADIEQAGEAKQEDVPAKQESQEIDATEDLRQRLRSLREQANQSQAEAQEAAAAPFANAEAALQKLSQQVEAQEDLEPEPVEVAQADLGVVAGSPEAPWSEDAAEKLATHCEEAGLSRDEEEESSGDELLIGTPEQEVSDAPVSYVYLQPNTPETGPQWFAQRFDEMSKRLDAVVGEKPLSASSDLASLLQRFDALEVRISDLLERTVGADGSETSGGSLHDIELCIAEIAGQLEATTAELARIEGIEQQISEVAKAIAEQRDAATSTAEQGTGQPFDMAALADLVADKVASKPMSLMSGEQADAPAAAGGIGELSATMKEFVRERRSEGEHTNAVLDTMQQTIIRVLDRMEALEAGAPRSGVAMPHATGQAANAPAAAPTPEAGSAQQQPAMPASPQQQVAHPAAPAQPKEAAASPEPISDEPATAPAAEAQSPESVSLDRLQRVMGQLDGTDKASATPSPVAETSAGKSDLSRNRAEFIKAARQAAAKASQPSDDATSEPAESDRARFAAAARQAAANANKRMINDDNADDEIDATHDGFSLSSLSARLQSATGGKKASAKNRGRTRLLVAALAIVAVGLGATKFMMSTSDKPARAQLQSSGVQQGTNVAVKPTPVPVTKVAATGREQGAGSFAQGVQPGTVAYRPETGTMVQPISVPPGASTKPVTDQPGRVSRKALPSALVGPLSMRLAAANGDPSAEFQVAARFADGKGVKQDLEEALKWYRRSAARGFALSQYRLGTFYERGLSVTKDVQRARVWYQRAASNGNVKAMHNLAVLAAGSSAGKPDYETAAKWFTAAAERGLGDSQFNLAILYRNGLGVPQDDAKAYKWFTHAASAGDKEAQRRMAEVEKQLGNDTVARLRSEMTRWSRKPTSKLANDPHFAGQAWQRKSADNS